MNHEDVGDTMRCPPMFVSDTEPCPPPDEWDGQETWGVEVWEFLFKGES